MSSQITTEQLTNDPVYQQVKHSSDPVATNDRTTNQMNDPLPSISTADLVLIIQYADRCPPVEAATFLDQQDIPYYILHVDRPFDESIFLQSRWRALVMLGGPQGAYEVDKYPLIHFARSLMKHQLSFETPILCICLSAQILADVIGGQSIKSHLPELGYSTMTLTNEGQSDPLCSSLRSFVENNAYINHHGDSFLLPPECPVLIASSTHPQAYRYGSAFAVQFHPESTAEEFKAWLEGDTPERMNELGKTKEQVWKEVQSQQPIATEGRQAFFTQWWKEVTNKQ